MCREVSVAPLGVDTMYVRVYVYVYFIEVKWMAVTNNVRVRYDRGVLSLGLLVELSVARIKVESRKIWHCYIYQQSTYP